MARIFSALNSTITGLILLVLWHMFFIVEIPYASIGDASGEFWYQHSYWGLLISSSAAILFSITSIAHYAYSKLKKSELSETTAKIINMLPIPATIGAAYGLYILITFIFVSC